MSNKEAIMAELIAERDRAVRALRRGGFEDRGGAEWVPPLGPAPRFIPVGAPDGYVLALQTVVSMPDGKNELGYTLLDGIGIFTSRQDVSDAIAKLSLPLGWVSMPTSQLLPGWMLPAAPSAIINTAMIADGTVFTGTALEHALAFASGADVTPASPWISVADRLPVVDDSKTITVLAIEAGYPGFPRPPSWCVARYHVNLGWQPVGATSWDAIVTHWMHPPVIPILQAG